MKVMIVVTHLLGTGHLSRALTLARAFRAADHTVQVVSGGLPAPHLKSEGIDILQLPPVRSDGVDFSRLLDTAGQEAGPHILNKRRSALCKRLVEFAPDVVITELFPFGRRILRNEFLDLLSAAQVQPKRPLICASIRDILAPPSKQKKADFADDVIHDFYDAVLVHSDPELMPLGLSWPVSNRLAPYLRYTGFVAPPAASHHPNGPGKGEIIVSAGGGDVGEHLFDCATEAAVLSSDMTWRLLIGGDGARARCDRIMNVAPPNLIAEPARPDFREMLYRARASVSFCGYNTALDVLQARCPAVFVPFDAGSEVEQGIRATALASQPGIDVLNSGDLTATTLLERLRKVLSDPRRPGQTQGFSGAAQSVSIVQDLWSMRS